VAALERWTSVHTAYSENFRWSFYTGSRQDRFHCTTCTVHYTHTLHHIPTTLHYTTLHTIHTVTRTTVPHTDTHTQTHTQTHTHRHTHTDTHTDTPHTQ